MKKLTPKTVYEVLKSNFPEQNDFAQSDYTEECQELQHFGIKTEQQLTELVLKHKQHVLEIDAENLDEQHIKWYKEDNSIDNLDDKITKAYWFALAGLLRITLELEFKAKYIEYARKRDGL